MHKMTITGKDLDLIWSYINWKMLYNKHLGGSREHPLLQQTVEEMKVVCRDKMKVYLKWEYYPGSQINSLFTFPRSAKGLCLNDWIENQGEVAIFITSAGEGIRSIYQQYKEEGQYLYSHAIQALAIETAEAAAEWLHQQIRQGWGVYDPPEMTMMERFQAKYKGRRYSFGYPACPDLEMQAKLFELLQPEHVSLTDGYMMEPEASVSAIVINHPQAEYFSVGKQL